MRAHQFKCDRTTDGCVEVGKEDCPRISLKNTNKLARENSHRYDRRGFFQLEMEAVHRLIEADLIAPFNLSREAAKLMIARGEGRIINITSIAGQIADAAKWLKQRTSLGRWGHPREIAGASAFLASPAASYITGQILAVDGRYLAHF